MYTKVRKVYYCDFCGKHGLRAITQHETHCTKNPNRHCRMCGRKGGLKVLIRLYKYAVCGTQLPSGGLTDVLHPTIDHLSNALYALTRRTRDGQEGCPACLLTIIRNTPLGKWPVILDFNYAEACKTWWKEQDEKASREDERQACYG